MLRRAAAGSARERERGKSILCVGSMKDSLVMRVHFEME
jgi:hypothetical protein